MSEPLDEIYFKWLYSQVASLRLKNPSRTYWSLLLDLFKKEFEWFVPNDDNRKEDGRDLRHEFVELHEIDDPDLEWLGLPCSMLEMMIGLSRRLSFEADGEPRDWFWHLVENLDLHKYNDKNYDDRGRDNIDRALDIVIWRRYSASGRGGLFPLKNPQSDQREVEVWYQLSAYLNELL
jgi:hypothetical protein